MAYDDTQEYYISTLRELYKASTDSQLVLTRDLVKQGMDVLYQTQSGNSAVYLATLFDDADTLSFLLDRGADVNARVFRKKVPLLSFATSSRNLKSMDVLLRAGADLKIKDDEGKDVFDCVQRIPLSEKEAVENILNREVKRRTVIAREKRRAVFEKAAQNVDKLSAPIRVRRHSGFKNQKGSK